MNKILLLLTLSALLLTCKSSAPATGTSSKIDRTTQSGFKGNWQITNVSFPGFDYIKVNVFQIADSKCFIGSTWTFVPNNNKGSMNLNQAGCTAFSSPIVWSINKEGMFGLKIIESGVKSKKVIQGFLLRVVKQTDTSFQLVDMINVSGQNREIVFQFEKI